MAASTLRTTTTGSHSSSCTYIYIYTYIYIFIHLSIYVFTYSFVFIFIGLLARVEARAPSPEPAKRTGALRALQAQGIPEERQSPQATGSKMRAFLKDEMTLKRSRAHTPE